MLNRFFSGRAPDDGDTQLIDLRYDRILLGVTMVLMGIGVVMVYSASVVTAKNETTFLYKQITYCAFAFVAMGVLANVHHSIIKRFAWPLFIGAFFLLGCVLIPGLAIEAKGAVRWIGHGSIRFQPSEGIKLGWIIILAAFLSDRQDQLHRWKRSWLTPTIIVGLISGLLLLQKDLGSTVICVGLLILMIFAAGAQFRHLLAAVGAGIVAICGFILLEPYRVRRLMSFLEPERYRQGEAWQLYQALIGFGSGEWMGLGLGLSNQKMAFLPEAHTDFIFSILGEELGVAGVAVVVSLFAVFAWRGFSIARRANTVFGALLAYGLTALICFQAIANMAVATGMLPTKGLTLPFISYGGSSMVMMGVAVGILLNISKREPPPEWLHGWVIDREPAGPGPESATEGAR
jgi:cell division protein FtsW